MPDMANDHRRLIFQQIECINPALMTEMW